MDQKIRGTVHTIVYNMCAVCGPERQSDSPHNSLQYVCYMWIRKSERQSTHQSTICGLYVDQKDRGTVHTTVYNMCAVCGSERQSDSPHNSLQYVYCMWSRKIEGQSTQQSAICVLYVDQKDRETVHTTVYNMCAICGSENQRDSPHTSLQYVDCMWTRKTEGQSTQQSTICVLYVDQKDRDRESTQQIEICALYGPERRGSPYSSPTIVHTAICELYVDEKIEAIHTAVCNMGTVCWSERQRDSPTTVCNMCAVCEPERRGSPYSSLQYVCCMCIRKELKSYNSLQNVYCMWTRTRRQSVQQSAICVHVLYMDQKEVTVETTVCNMHTACGSERQWETIQQYAICVRYMDQKGVAVLQQSAICVGYCMWTRNKRQSVQQSAICVLYMEKK